jgi:hypothetical protein
MQIIRSVGGKSHPDIHSWPENTITYGEVYIGYVDLPDEVCTDGAKKIADHNGFDVDEIIVCYVNKVEAEDGDKFTTIKWYQAQTK